MRLGFGSKVNTADKIDAERAKSLQAQIGAEADKRAKDADRYDSDPTHPVPQTPAIKSKIKANELEQKLKKQQAQAKIDNRNRKIDNVGNAVGKGVNAVLETSVWGLAAEAAGTVAGTIGGAVPGEVAVGVVAGAGLIKAGTKLGGAATKATKKFGLFGNKNKT
jgi:hypothetical protein